MGENMKIIAQKNNALTTSEFLENSLKRDFIDAMSLNVTYTQDNKIVVYSAPTTGVAITNTINNATLGQLQGYEVTLLSEILKNLSESSVKKDLYLNLAPYNAGILSDDNIQTVTEKTHDYIMELKEVIDLYKNLKIYIHSINRSLAIMLKQLLPSYKIGFAFTGSDFSFADVDYYVLLASIQNDVIIDSLLKNNKDVIIYVYSDYYLSYLYEHYLGEKSTPYLQETFEKLGFMGNYPEIIYRIFRD